MFGLVSDDGDDQSDCDTDSASGRTGTGTAGMLAGTQSLSVGRVVGKIMSGN